MIVFIMIVQRRRTYGGPSDGRRIPDIPDMVRHYTILISHIYLLRLGDLPIPVYGLGDRCCAIVGHHEDRVTLHHVGHCARGHVMTDRSASYLGLQLANHMFQEVFVRGIGFRTSY